MDWIVPCWKLFWTNLKALLIDKIACLFYKFHINLLNVGLLFVEVYLIEIELCLLITMDVNYIKINIYC